MRPGSVRCGRCSQVFEVLPDRPVDRDETSADRRSNSTGPASYDSVMKEIVALKARVALLEARAPAGTGSRHTPADQGASRALIGVQVSNKRVDANERQLWLDCTFRADGLKRRMRAAKGTLEFCDLFGAVILPLQFTLNDRLHPGQALARPGMKFQYNEFMADHQWMLATDLHDMIVRFNVDQIIWEDA